MPACTSTSRPVLPVNPLVLGLALALGLLPPTVGRAQGADEPTAPAATTPRPQQAEEDDLKETPYTGYGEFNEQEDEESSSRFFQYGRFFGVSLGLGFNGVTGNRGVLYQGGFPAVDFKVMYWFDFDFALELGLTTMKHFYESTSRGFADISMNRVGVDLRYYLPMDDFAAPITFANPYLVVGAGAISKSEVLREQATTETDTGAALTLGAGLEFTIAPRKVYFGLTGRYHLVTFSDTFTTQFQSEPIPVTDLTGGFYTLTGNILFTW